MRIKKGILFFSGAVLLFGVVVSLESIMAVYFLHTQPYETVTIEFVKQKKRVPVEEVILEEDRAPDIVVEESDVLPEKILIDVPFAPQAPFANWADPRQDYGCEEASILMAVYWAEEKELSFKKAEEEIIAISEFEESMYGNFYDTSAADTLMVLKAYFGYQDAYVQYDIGIEDIKNELAQGNVIIVPINGRLLHNPYFTPPGPPKHKIVIRGYDNGAQEFIVNDPGTRRGEAYRYSYAVIEEALLDYPSGRDEDIVDPRTAMIVVEKAGDRSVLTPDL